MLCQINLASHKPKSSESHVSVSVVVVIFVKWVDADSVDVLMVELHDEFIVMTLGTEEFLVFCAALLLILLVLAVLK